MVAANATSDLRFCDGNVMVMMVMMVVVPGWDLIS